MILTLGVGTNDLFSPVSASPNHDGPPVAIADQRAPRLQYLGSYIFPVTTTSQDAQLFINQGLMLAYGFNHAEATRSFGEAARLDPACAMAYWGMALVGGPNINMDMSADAARELGRLQQIAAMDSLKGLQVTFSRNGARAILEIAVEVLAGELAAARGDLEQAIVRLHRGVLLEDNLIYMEPPDWHVPVRQSLGAVLLAAGRAAEAWSVDLLDLEGRSLQQRGNRETLRLHLLRRQPQRSGHGSKVSM